MMWMIKKILTFVIRTYQKVASPLLPRTCRYYPSCSEYAIQSIEKHGTAKGALLSARRILSCSRYGRGGHDPVPD